MAAVSAAPGHPEIIRVLAPNPGPMTLDGTNSYVVGRDPAHVIDPGPDDRAHIERLHEIAVGRGGLGGVLLTHSHADHTAAVGRLGGELLWGEPGVLDEAAALAAAIEATDQEVTTAVEDTELDADRHRSSAPGAGIGARPIASGSGTAAANPQGPATDGPASARRAGPFTVIPTPGHAAEHVSFVFERVCFCGDLILGTGSSVVPPAAAGGSLADYMGSLERLAGLDLELMCPGHGGWITDPTARIAEYRAHRVDRESKLRAALDTGERSRARLLDLVWDDVPSELRVAAALAMEAHLEKLGVEGRPVGELRD